VPRGAGGGAPIGTWEARIMTAVQAIIDTVNELAQAPLRAGSRVWGGGPNTRAAARRAVASTRAAAVPPPDARYACGNVEPPLDELLGDPIVHQVMRADRLEPADVRRALGAERPAAL
jgi:hypothetical protein